MADASSPINNEGQPPSGSDISSAMARATEESRGASRDPLRPIVKDAPPAAVFHREDFIPTSISEKPVSALVTESPAVTTPPPTEAAASPLTENPGVAPRGPVTREELLAKQAQVEQSKAESQTKPPTQEALRGAVGTGTLKAVNWWKGNPGK